MANVISGVIRDLEQPGLMPGLEEERQKLLNLLQAVLPVLKAVDGIVENEDEADVSSWIEDLTAAAYEADDIVDEFRYAKLQAQVETDRCQHGSKVRTGIFTFCKISGMRRSQEGRKRETQLIRERLTEVSLKIEDVVEKSKKLVSPERISEMHGLMPCAEDRQDPAISSLKEFDAVIVGRDQEKDMIVRQLIDISVRDTAILDNRIFSISGYKGTGKTTLARFICSDVRIKGHFDFILWVEVGADYNFAGIAKSVIDQVKGKDCCLSESDIDILKHRMNQELSGKRYLLVLNDVRDIVDMYMLKSDFGQSIATGSFLVEKSRYFFGMEYMTLKIDPLTEDVLWDLFCRRAIIAEKIGPEVRNSMRKIIERTGLPLLVNLIGGMMRFKKEPEEWQQIISQLYEITTNPSFDDELIFDLCFSQLSSEIKQCFAFSSLFHGGHYIDREVLVRLWMANGLLSADGPTTSLEEKGNHIFNELAVRNFFEDVKRIPRSSSRDKYGYHDRVICKMHGLIYDYCEMKFQIRILSQDSNHEASLMLKVHLSILHDSPVDISELIKHSPHVRTLMFLGDPFIRTINWSALSRLQSLRVLHLPSAKFDGDLFEMKYTKYLRYLNLSGSRIKKIPKSTSSLYFLQTLNLSNCLLLCQLPEDMRYMRSLEHLYLHECPKLKKMPGHLGELGSLKTLTTYIIGETSGNGIDEIKFLKLGGLLELYNLRKVKSEEMARGANLSSKTNLERLTLCWGGKQLVMSKEINDLAVMEALQPHAELKVLKVQQYGGPVFATWLANPAPLLNLVELHLIGCAECKTLPAVWKLESLQVLCIKHMVGLTSMFQLIPDNREEDSSKLFKSLKRLVLVGLWRLKRWHEEEWVISFSELDEMEITDCPDLETIPNVPTLGYLTISIENHRLLCSVIDLITLSKKLVQVHIAKASSSDGEPLSELRGELVGRNCHKLRVMRLDSTDSFFMPRAIPYARLDFWKSLKSLENLDIFNCNSITAWPLEEFRSLSKLKRLSMRMCPHLTGVPPTSSPLQEGEELLPQLVSLEFYACRSLKEIPMCSSIRYMELDECPDINSIQHFNNLEMLFLSCTSWTSLPSGFEDLKKLESLRVSECYSLTCLPNELAGLTSLRTLIINKCPRVESLPTARDLNPMLSGLTKFQIHDCPHLAHLEKFFNDSKIESEGDPSESDDEW